MRELLSTDGQVEGWHIRSGFEAKIIGRAAVLHDPNESTTLFFHHTGTEDMPISEVEFLDRDMKYGRLVISKSLARNAEEAFRAIVDSGQAWNGIQPDVAQAFVTMLDEGRQPPDVVQVPDLFGPIHIKGYAKRAA